MTVSFSRRARAIAALCTFAFATVSLSAPPAAPTVTYTSLPKRVAFQWNYVPQANYYEVWWKPNAGAAAVRMASRTSSQPRYTQSLSAHLVHWNEMRWEVKACNPSGCTSTGPINIGSTIVWVPGFYTGPVPRAGERLGQRVAISASRANIAAANADGDVNYYHHGLPGDLDLREVFSAPGELLPNYRGEKEVNISMSATGGVLLLSYPSEYWGASGVPEDERGAVYVYSYRPGTGQPGLLLDRRFAELNKRRQGAFAALSEDGKVLAYSYTDRSGTPQGKHMAIYRRGAGGWVLEKEIPDAPGAFFCHDQRTLSGDGKTIARRCLYTNTALNTQEARIEVFAAPNWTLRDTFVAGTGPDFVNYGPLATDFTGDTLVTATWTNSFPENDYDPQNYRREVRVFRRAGVYSQIATLRPGPYEPTQYSRRSFFGEELAISRNGEYIGVVDQHDSIPGLVQPPATGPGTTTTPRGAVYVFEKRGTGYRLRRHIGVTTQTADLDDPVLGNIAFSDNGKDLLIGHPRSRSNGTGPAGGRDNTSLTDAGAFWLY